MLSHQGTVRLETERLILRRCGPEDLEPAFRNCFGDKEVWQWTRYAPMDCVEDVVSRAGMFTEKWLGWYSRPNRYSWAVALRETDECIGRMFGMHPDDEAAQVELAYELGRAWWGRGLMTEAVGAVLDFFFTQVGMDKVVAYHADANPASGRVMRKCGMRYVKTMPDGCQCNAGVFDSLWYELTAEEYFRRKQK